MSIRQRIPFKFSESTEDDGRILDEQEQEELIENLRKESEESHTQYLIFLQVALALSCVLHYIFLLQQPKQSPFLALFPRLSAGTSSTIPAPMLFALLHIFLHINLGLNLLSSSHSLRRTLSSLPPPLRFFPLSPSDSFAIGAASIAPIVSLLLQNGWADLLWWSMAGLMTSVVYMAKVWMIQNEESIKELEGMRYKARGA